MGYNTLNLESTPSGYVIIFNRPSQRNSITSQFLEEFNHVLDSIEMKNEPGVVVIKGTPGVFCSGMDFSEAAESLSRVDGEQCCDTQSLLSEAYLQTIKRLTLFPRFIISEVDGDVIAGGVGLVSASDFVVATPASKFSLPEPLWGLLPACVTPYLIRRVGFQNASRMVLSTLPIDADKALKINLVDELTENPEKVIRRLSLRLNRIDTKTIKRMKIFLRKMWIVSEEMENTAIQEIGMLMADDSVKRNIINYVKNSDLPWQQSSKGE